MSLDLVLTLDVLFCVWHIRCSQLQGLCRVDTLTEWGKISYAK